MRRTTSRRVLFVIGIATGGLAVTAPVAGAATPANQACVGTSLSSLARQQLEPGGFGHAVAGFAQEPENRPGLGDGIQAFQAGAVDDSIVPNTCND